MDQLLIDPNQIRTMGMPVSDDMFDNNLIFLITNKRYSFPSILMELQYILIHELQPIVILQNVLNIS